ncbi:hypothetical protein N7451_002848 [Penicillium sp. IBT 35674x]|nr:hypothetical protein N7451_002848 [Penicillium sp. IBT 35674x]
MHHVTGPGKENDWHTQETNTLQLDQVRPPVHHQSLPVIDIRFVVVVEFWALGEKSKEIKYGQRIDDAPAGASDQDC